MRASAFAFDVSALTVIGLAARVRAVEHRLHSLLVNGPPRAREQRLPPRPRVDEPARAEQRLDGQELAFHREPPRGKRGGVGVKSRERLDGARFEKSTGA